MKQKTNENKLISSGYQELNPEMDAFLVGYLEDGRHRGLRESTIHLHDKIGHYFLVLCQEKVQIKHAFFKVGLPCQSFCFFV